MCASDRINSATIFQSQITISIRWADRRTKFVCVLSIRTKLSEISINSNCCLSSQFIVYVFVQQTDSPLDIHGGWHNRKTIHTPNERNRNQFIQSISIELYMWYSFPFESSLVFHRLHLLSLWARKCVHCTQYTVEPNIRYSEMKLMASWLLLSLVWLGLVCVPVCCEYRIEPEGLIQSVYCAWTEVPRAAFTHLWCRIHGIDNGKMNWTKRHNNNSSADCFNSPALLPAFASISTFSSCVFLYGLLCCVFFISLDDAAAFIIVFVIAYNNSASILVLFSVLLCWCAVCMIT